VDIVQEKDPVPKSGEKLFHPLCIEFLARAGGSAFEPF
jgi:hypothetical protein